MRADRGEYWIVLLQPQKKAIKVSFLKITMAIPIKCFVSHRPPSHEGGSVGRAKKKKKKNEHMIAY